MEDEEEEEEKIDRSQRHGTSRSDQGGVSNFSGETAFGSKERPTRCQISSPVKIAHNMYIIYIL